MNQSQQLSLWQLCHENLAQLRRIVMLLPPEREGDGRHSVFEEQVRNDVIRRLPPIHEPIGEVLGVIPDVRGRAETTVVLRDRERGIRAPKLRASTVVEQQVDLRL